MEPHRFGRKLGIGVRVASRMAKERAAKASAAAATATQTAAAATATQTAAAATATQTAAPQAATTPPPQSRPATPPPPRAPRDYAEPARRVGEGTRRFGKAFWGPLAHVSGTLWLEITGLFFALFAVFFGQNAWKTRAAALHGPEHAHFLLYVGVTLVFIYFCISSFVKASRRGRRTTQ